MSQTLKTAREWFETFPEPYRSQAMKNARDLKDTYDAAHKALSCEFVWDESPEGQDHWREFQFTLEPKWYLL